jgi:hypothetical protein
MLSMVLLFGVQVGITDLGIGNIIILDLILGDLEWYIILGMDGVSVIHLVAASVGIIMVEAHTMVDGLVLVFTDQLITNGVSMAVIMEEEQLQSINQTLLSIDRTTL